MGKDVGERSVLPIFRSTHSHGIPLVTHSTVFTIRQNSSITGRGQDRGDFHKFCLTPRGENFILRHTLRRTPVPRVPPEAANLYNNSKNCKISSLFFVNENAPEGKKQARLG